MKKFIIFILCLLLTGCTTIVQEASLNLFDIKEAKEITSQYMNALSEGEISTAESLCEDKLISREEVAKLENNKFVAYKIEEVNEGADYAYIKYVVIRGNNTDIRADLDSIEFKVSKKESEYKITEIEAKNLKQVYLEKENLRIIDGLTGKSDLLLRKRELPREVYTKSSKVTLTMDTVPTVEFSKINTDFQGRYVGITLENGDKILVVLSVIGEVDDSLNLSGSSVTSENSDIEEILEKPLAQKIVGYDLIDAEKTEKILFTENDEILVVQVKKKGEGSTIRIYKNLSGEFINLGIDHKFPSDKYSIDIKKITAGEIHIEVIPLNSDVKDGGKYIINIEKMDIYKDE